MSRTSQILAAACAAVAFSALCPEVGEPASRAKRGYHLFHPTPDSLLRDLSADRPDLTESPYTVDAGRFQVEMDALRYTRDETTFTVTESWSPLVLNLKVGLDPATDLQIVTEWRRFERVRVESLGIHSSRDGWGDLVVRVKRNLSGNDEGRVATALLPYVSFPTSTNGLGDETVSFGLALPVGVDLGSGWSLGVMGQVDRVEDAAGDGKHAEWTTTATVSRPISGTLGGFVEFAATFPPSAEGTWIGTFDTGLTWSPSPNMQLDAGVYVGASDAAEDMTYFLGLTARR